MTLTPHTRTPCAAVREITVEVSRRGRALSLSFDVFGDMNAIAIPEWVGSARADELWRHTCFEAFLRAAPAGRSSRRKSGPSGLVVEDDGSNQSERLPEESQLGPDFRRDEREEGYVEINLSPSNQWAVYVFDGYRSGMRAAAAVERRALERSQDEGRFGLSTIFDLNGLDALPSAPWRLGLSAVIELKDGSKSYWALAHAPGQPDFHHPDAFAAILPPDPS
ncbi:MAG: DOMON-like domain-containing protein [Caulobacter sp.]|nr:DOMON-like domain-containing protein [Caulobacter sp.]